MTTAPKPRRVINMSARHRVTGETESYRIRDPRMGTEEALVIFGIFLASLGWKREHVKMVSAYVGKEDAVTMAIRKRLYAP
jgi:hypothetical protein